MKSYNYTCNCFNQTNSKTNQPFLNCNCTDKNNQSQFNNITQSWEYSICSAVKNQAYLSCSVKPPICSWFNLTTYLNSLPPVNFNSSTSGNGTKSNSTSGSTNGTNSNNTNTSTNGTKTNGTNSSTGNSTKGNSSSNATSNSS